MGTKLVVSIVQHEDADQLMRALNQEGYTCTKIGSTGGFLRRGNVTLLVGAEEAKVTALLNIITRTCHKRTHLANPYLFMEPDGYMAEPIEVEVGGAVVFVLEIDRMLRV